MIAFKAVVITMVIIGGYGCQESKPANNAPASLNSKHVGGVIKEPVPILHPHLGFPLGTTLKIEGTITPVFKMLAMNNYPFVVDKVNDNTIKKTEIIILGFIHLSGPC
jgi:hypothetical protein